MKLTDIADPELQAWALDYTQKKLADRNTRRIGAEDLRRIWASMTRADWAARRVLVEELAPKVERRLLENPKLTRLDLDLAISRFLSRRPTRTYNGIEYAAPFSLGLQIAATREWLSETKPEATGQLPLSPSMEELDRRDLH